MHTFRLIAMAEEIGRLGEVNVRRNERDYLLGIKKGEFEYEDLLIEANERIESLEEIYELSELAVTPDLVTISKLHVEMREKLYMAQS